MPALRASAVHGVSPNGVLGDPAGASADEGAALFRDLLADLTAYLKRWPDARP
jgi:creatinine amidohydrolase